MSDYKFATLPGEFTYKGINWVLWSNESIIKRIEDPDQFKFYDDDTLVATYPKSGTTLLQEIVWLILNEADVDTAKKSKVFERVPFIDENYTHDFPGFPSDKLPIDVVPDWPRPRILKTHLLPRNLDRHFSVNNPPKMKIVVCLRNPKDTAVSMYNFYCGAVDYGPFKDGWDAFFERWKRGHISGGNWLEVTAEWWKLHQNSEVARNLKVAFYEDLVTKKRESIEDLCGFLGAKLTPDQINTIVGHTSFDSMQKNPMTNYEGVLGFEKDFKFMRKGKIGDWKNWMTLEQSKYLDQLYEPTLNELGLKFQYE